ncbi:unnamed protein product [Effrenium voratum]|nr:unnamed protein product [Effrenium voratum]
MRPLQTHQAFQLARPNNVKAYQDSPSTSATNGSSARLASRCSTSFPLVGRDRELFFKEGPLVHFVLPAHMRLEDLSCDPCSPAAGACSLVARACIAGVAVCGEHITLGTGADSLLPGCLGGGNVFEDGVVTVTRRFKGRFQRKRQTEYHVLKECMTEIKNEHASEDMRRTSGIKFELLKQVSQSMAGICKKEESLVKTEFSFSTTAAGEDGTSIKRQPTVKAEMGQSADEKAAVVKAEPVSLEENPSWTGHQSHRLAGNKLPDLDGQMTAWARQCAEFRRKSTWTPSRPCCPASLFFSSPIVPEEKDPPCVQRLSQKELCCLRRFFERGSTAACGACPAQAAQKPCTAPKSGSLWELPGSQLLSPLLEGQLLQGKLPQGAGTKRNAYFSVSRFMKDGRDEAEAEAAALEAAKAFRAELVARGYIKEKLRDERLTSDVLGVRYDKAMKKWRVEISKPGSKTIRGGRFTEKAAAEARATELRELHGLQRTVKSCAARAELPVFLPKADTGGSNRKQRAFKPLDHSELELEKAFATAVAWLKKQRKELRQLMDRASPKATLKKACTARGLRQAGKLKALQVQLLSDDPVLPYRPEGTIELQLEASEAAEAWPLVPELLQAAALWQPPEGEDQPSCALAEMDAWDPAVGISMVLLCCFTAPPWRNFDACRRFAAGLRGIDDHFGALCALQSAFLGHAQSGRELLAQLLAERTTLALLVCFAPSAAVPMADSAAHSDNDEDLVTATRRFKVPLPAVQRETEYRVKVSQSMGNICKKEESQEGLDLHNLWLQVKMEVKEEEIEAMGGDPGGWVKTEPTESKVKIESSFSTAAAGEDGTSIKRQPKVKVEKGQSDGKAAVGKAEPVSLEETGRSGHSLAGNKLPDLEDQMTAWARQCAEFRRKSTWMPSRPVLLTKKPCCPASLFFSSSIVPEEKDPPCVQRLSQKELCCLRRFFERAAAAATQEDASFPASGAACMKMWPWMRDLPSSIWAGRGLAYDEQRGLRRLSCAGGAEAMQDVQSGSLLELGSRLLSHQRPHSQLLRPGLLQSGMQGQMFQAMP